MKKAAQDCSTVRKKIDDRIFQNFFTQSLDTDLEAYVILHEQIAEDNAKTLTLDKIIEALGEFETRMKDQELGVKVLG